MKKYRSLCALILSIAALFIFQEIGWGFAVTYDQKVTVEGNPIAEIKVVSKDAKMRAESNFGGMTAVMLRNETGTYSYLPAQNMATKIPASMDRPNLTRDIPRFMEFLQENNGQKIGSEVLEGNKEADIYTFIEPTLKKEAKAWVWKEKNFPLKIEVNAPEGRTVVELYNINLAPQINEKDFQVPTGAKVVDLAAPPASTPTPLTPTAPTVETTVPPAAPVAAGEPTKESKL